MIGYIERHSVREYAEHLAQSRRPGHIPPGLVEGDDGEKCSYERAEAATTTKATGAVAKVRGAMSAPGFFYFLVQDLGVYFFGLMMCLAVRGVFSVFVIPGAASISRIRITDAVAPRRHLPGLKLGRCIRVTFRALGLELPVARLYTRGGLSCCAQARMSARGGTAAARGGTKTCSLGARATAHFPLIVASRYALGDAAVSDRCLLRVSLDHIGAVSLRRARRSTTDVVTNSVPHRCPLRSRSSSGCHRRTPSWPTAPSRTASSSSSS